MTDTTDDSIDPAADHPLPEHLPPDGCDEATVEAVGLVTEALEATERARGHLYSFHQLTGTADLELDRTVELLRKAGHPEWAETVRTQVLGRNVIPGHWTFQIVEAYDATYYQPFRDIERAAVEELAEGRDHLYEAGMKEARRTAGHPDHTARPDTTPTTEPGEREQRGEREHHDDR